MAAYSLTLCRNDSSTVSASNAADCSVYPLQRSQSILKNLQLYDYPSQAKCGGKAVCTLCRVKILEGAAHCNKPVPEELIHFSQSQLEQGWRLACQLYCLRDLHLFVPPLSPADL